MSDGYIPETFIGKLMYYLHCLDNCLNHILSPTVTNYRNVNNLTSEEILEVTLLSAQYSPNLFEDVIILKVNGDDPMLTGGYTHRLYKIGENDKLTTFLFYTEAWIYEYYYAPIQDCAELLNQLKEALERSNPVTAPSAVTLPSEVPPPTPRETNTNDTYVPPNDTYVPPNDNDTYVPPTDNDFDNNINDLRSNESNNNETVSNTNVNDNNDDEKYVQSEERVSSNTGKKCCQSKSVFGRKKCCDKGCQTSLFEKKCCSKSETKFKKGCRCHKWRTHHYFMLIFGLIFVAGAICLLNYEACYFNHYTEFYCFSSAEWFFIVSLVAINFGWFSLVIASGCFCCHYGCKSKYCCCYYKNDVFDFRQDYY